LCDGKSASSAFILLIPPLFTPPKIRDVGGGYKNLIIIVMYYYFKYVAMLAIPFETDRANIVPSSMVILIKI
jgi:hypothetical protein